MSVQRETLNFILNAVFVVIGLVTFTMFTFHTRISKSSAALFVMQSNTYPSLGLFNQSHSAVGQQVEGD